jgi:hypothetical protein
MDLRQEAATFADSILNGLEQPVAGEDLPSMRSIIMELALFEDPMPVLRVSVNSVGQEYKITVSGYKSFIDQVRWVNTFLGNHRSMNLSNVTGSYLQFTDVSAFMVIVVSKVDMHVASHTLQPQTTRTVAKRTNPLVKRTY